MAVFVGYLTVWLPGPAAGLRLLGVEMGEWLKFLGLGQRRDLFYLPPVTLALTMALLAASWPNGRWQTWFVRGTAVAVSLLAFPALEAIEFEPAREWLLRLQLIGLVVIVTVFSSLIGSKRATTSFRRPLWVLLALLGLVGAILPAWVYLVARPLVSEAIGLPVGIGLGVWLNSGGHLLVTAVSLWQLVQFSRSP